MNPFKYGCIVDGGYFCNRPILSRQLEDYIRSGQNLVIQGERRIGKSSLVTNTIRNMAGYRLLYADFMNVRSVSDVCNQVADALSRFDAEDSIFKRTISLLAHLRPTVTVDALTGLPTISVDTVASRDVASINTIMNAISEHVKDSQTCVVFDEFQDILRLDDGDRILAMMRSKIQFLGGTSFVFLGSARNAMLDIFMSPNSPFYKSATTFDVGAIPDDDFYAFIRERFMSGRRELMRCEFDAILDFTKRIPGDVQEYCDAIWQVTENGSVISPVDLENGLRRIFAREGTTFSVFERRLTDIQFRVLRALSICGGKHPLSNEFLETASVFNPNSVKRALHSIMDAGLIYAIDNEYKFISPFFCEWIKRKVRI